MGIKYGKLTLLLIIICLMLGGVSLYICKEQDTTLPVITIDDSDVTYKEGDSYDGLFKGVTAKDDRDGDVTDDIFVSQVRSLDNGEAVVTYGVMDSACNIGTAKRIVGYEEK